MCAARQKKVYCQPSTLLAEQMGAPSMAVVPAKMLSEKQRQYAKAYRCPEAYKIIDRWCAYNKHRDMVACLAHLHQQMRLIAMRAAADGLPQRWPVTSLLAKRRIKSHRRHRSTMMKNRMDLIYRQLRMLVACGLADKGRGWCQFLDVSERKAVLQEVIWTCPNKRKCDCSGEICTQRRLKAQEKRDRFKLLHASRVGRGGEAWKQARVHGRFAPRPPAAGETFRPQAAEEAAHPRTPKNTGCSLLAPTKPSSDNLKQHPAFPVRGTSCEPAEGDEKAGCHFETPRTEASSAPGLDDRKAPAAGCGTGNKPPEQKPAAPEVCQNVAGQDETAFFASCQRLIDDPALREALPEPVRLAAAERPGDRQRATRVWGRIQYGAELPQMRWWILDKHSFSRLVVRAAIATALHQKWRTQSNFEGRIVALCRRMRKNGVFEGWERKEQARGTSIEGTSQVFGLLENSFHFVLDVEHRHEAAAQSRNHELRLCHLQAVPSTSDR